MNVTVGFVGGRYWPAIFRVTCRLLYPSRNSTERPASLRLLAKLPRGGDLCTPHLRIGSLCVSSTGDHEGALMLLAIRSEHDTQTRGLLGMLILVGILLLGQLVRSGRNFRPELPYGPGQDDN